MCIKKRRVLDGDGLAAETHLGSVGHTLLGQPL